MTTLAALLQDVRYRLDETVAANFTDAELTRYINDALKDISRKCEVILDRAEIATDTENQEYQCPVDVVRINRVEWFIGVTQSHYTLEYRDFNSMDMIWGPAQTQRIGTPQWYTLWGYPPNLKIILYPTPSEDGFLKIYYYRTAATLQDSQDEAQIPAGWEDLIVLFTEFTALRKDHDPRWQEAKGLYDQNLAAMNETTRRWTDQAGMFVTQTNNMVPAWLWGGEGY